MRFLGRDEVPPDRPGARRSGRDRLWQFHRTSDAGAGRVRQIAAGWRGRVVWWTLVPQ